MSFLGIICCLIGLIRGKTPARRILSLLFSKISETVFFAVLLLAGFYVFYYHLEYGRHQLEVLVYFVSTTVRLLFVLPRISKEIDDIWRAVDDPNGSD